MADDPIDRIRGILSDGEREARIQSARPWPDAAGRAAECLADARRLAALAAKGAMHGSLVILADCESDVIYELQRAGDPETDTQTERDRMLSHAQARYGRAMAEYARLVTELDRLGLSQTTAQPSHEYRVERDVNGATV